MSITWIGVGLWAAFLLAVGFVFGYEVGHMAGERDQPRPRPMKGEITKESGKATGHEVHCEQGISIVYNRGAGDGSA